MVFEFGIVDFEIVLKLLIAVGLGAMIGFERELKHRPAGLRTHMLVSLGATIFTVSSLSFDVEPARIAAGIVAGIGFLGAGNIIAHKGHVQGITSAATLWVVAGIGLSVGIGEYFIAVVSSVLIFAILQLGRFEKKSHME
ncbi:MgtC/SapB family protein [Candidatus Nitrosopumilus sediminis]|uniref:MgtC/SapB transporter n=1 Tax=Candidatus Nitrosopumilus sediminis TaxID=1229909 RepID=K0B846_9ARCH|nr:MgtC/SapB family protein [Candidatus Nitrosopumilus sediminis]AFS82303.1 MgtC/SapB transporter [Candidatus Nitrosopumilus sediminis]